MNSSEISAILNSHPGIKKTFMGVYPADMLPINAKTAKPGFYIANTDPHFKAGEHWVAFYIPSNPKTSPMEYWDSYGFKPPEILTYFLNPIYMRNTKFIQHPFSSTCGQYCIYYILKRYTGLSMEEIVSFFSVDTLENDVIVNQTVENNFCVDLDIFNIKYLHQQICHSYK